MRPQNTIKFEITDRDRLLEGIQSIREMMEHDWDEEDFAEFEEQVAQGDKTLVEVIVFWFPSLAECGRVCASDWCDVGLDMVCEE